MLWDLLQEANIQDLAKLAFSLNERVQTLERENAELRIRSAAVVRLAIDRSLFSAEDFSRAVGELKKQAARPQSGRAPSEC